MIFELSPSDVVEIRVMASLKIKEIMTDVRRNGDFFGEEWKRLNVSHARDLNHIRLKVGYNNALL